MRLASPPYPRQQLRIMAAGLPRLFLLATRTDCRPTIARMKIASASRRPALRSQPRVSRPVRRLLRHRPRPLRRKRNFWSIVVFILLISGIGIRAWRDLSQPDAWDYWKDQYFSPSLKSQLIDRLDLDASGKGRRALLVSGTIGPAAANWFRGQLTRPISPRATSSAVVARRRSGPGADHGRDHPAARAGHRGRQPPINRDASSPSYCASACVLVYAGGKTRFGVPGSALGVHRFVTTRPADDPSPMRSGFPAPCWAT